MSGTSIAIDSSKTIRIRLDDLTLRLTAEDPRYPTLVVESDDGGTGGDGMKRAYYNEIDPYAAQWLRNLIADGHLPDGDVDERDIRDVVPADLAGYRQCHFFAGLGGWPYALRLAGVSDDYQIWTGSPPCQPFSQAGKHGGVTDERHLWPTFFNLIRQCRPSIVVGEQVSSAINHGWYDALCDDLESEGYACGAVIAPACSVGAPHIRERLFWVADADSGRCLGRGAECVCVQGTAQHCAFGGLADADSRQRDRVTDGEECERDRTPTGREQGDSELAASGELCGMADTKSNGRQRRAIQPKRGMPPHRTEEVSGDDRPIPLNSFWRDADWLGCRDGKWRPVIATHVALVDGLSGTMGHLRSKRETEERVSGYASSGTADTNQILPPLRGSTGAEDNQRETGGSRCVHAQTLLRPEVHGARDGQGELRKPKPFAGESASTSEVGMRDLRSNREAARSPSGREPFQQFAVELDDIVSLLPPSIALAANDGRWRDAEALRSLCDAICKAGAVQYAPEQAQAAWASLGEEAKNRIRVGFDVRAWRKLVFNPLSAGEPARVGKLRAYGNAIVPALAAKFIQAVMP